MRAIFAGLGITGPLAGLGLAVLASAAMAQGAVQPQPLNPPPLAGAPDQAKPGQPDGAVAGRPPKPTAPAEAKDAGAADDYEGMIVETPHGTYMVTEPRDGTDGQMHEMREPPRPASGEDEANQPPRPMPPMGRMARPMPPNGAARFRIHSGDMDVSVGCATDEPMKSCIDAIGALVDKVGSIQHH